MPAMPRVTLGPYRLDEVLGRGAFGIVWRAEEIHERRTVAVKVHPSGGRALARLHRELLLLDGVDHPAIPVPERLGALDEGGWLAMTFAPGTAATAHAALLGPPGDPVRTARSAGVIVDLLEALHALHDRGVVHADVKSSNLRVDADGRVTLLDLGGAQHLGEDGALGAVATSTAASVEQLVGAPVDARADLHAVGVVAYTMLVGERPYPKDGDPIADRARRPFRPPHVAAPGVPRELSITVMRLLALSPADRPPSARAAADALRALGFAGVGWTTTEEAPPPEATGPDPLLGEVTALRRRGALSSADRRLAEAGAPSTVDRALERALLDTWLGRTRRARLRARALLGTSRALDAACVLARASEVAGTASALVALGDAPVGDDDDRARRDAWRARLLAGSDPDVAADLAFHASAGLRSSRPDVRADVAAALGRALPALAPDDAPRRPDARLDRLDALVATLAGALADDDLDRATDALAAARRLSAWIARGLSPDDRAAWALRLTTLGVW